MFEKILAAIDLDQEGASVVLDKARTLCRGELWVIHAVEPQYVQYSIDPTFTGSLTRSMEEDAIKAARTRLAEVCDGRGIDQTHQLVPLGRAVAPGDLLGFVADPLGTDEWQVEATLEGVVIGRTNDGLVDEGNALFHIAVPSAEIDVEEHIAESGDALPSLDPADDDHPVPHDPYSDL